VRLLVVDDHAECRAMASRLLVVLGHEVLEAADAQQAESILHRERDSIDLVLLDLFLGETDGVTLAKRLEAERPGLRVLFMSGHGEDTCDLEDLAGPRRQFLEKPFSFPALQAALESLAHRP
jgi:two-component system, cell cycle sensor histidine kinase and response regulator CckA